MKNNHEITSLSFRPHSLPKIKQLFLTKTKWRCLVASDVQNVNKYQPKMLKSLEITHLNDEKITFLQIRQLRKALIDAKKVSSLAVQKDDQQRTYQTTAYLGLLFGSISHFKKLSFRLTDKTMSKVLNENMIKSLARLGRCKELSNLQIHFSCHEQTKNRIINRLSSELRALPKLQTLSFDLNNCSSFTFRGATGDYDPNAPLLKFKYPERLSALKLNFEGAASIKPELLHIFITNLQKCSQLKSLNLNSYGIFANSDVIQPLTWAPLLKTLEKSLQILTLKKHFSTKNMLSFLDDFSHLKNLITLDLDILSDVSIGMFQIFITTLYNHLASFPNLISLTLRVSRVKRLGSELQFLFSSIENLTQLQHLEIEIPSTAELNLFNFQSLCQSLKHLIGLKKLVLDFPSKGISFECVVLLAYTVKTLTSLEDLTLKFHQANISYKSLDIVLKCLSELPLRNLNLNLGKADWNFKEEPKSTEIFSGLGSGFRSLTNLKINFTNLKIPPSAAKKVFIRLRKLPQLLSLQVSLPEFSSFKKMPILSSLSLSLEGKTDDAEISYLARNLQDYWHLRSLNLYFGGADQLTEISLLRLSAWLKTLRKLKELQLVFSRELGFSNESVFSLLESLSDLKMLQSLSFKDSSGILNPKLVTFARNLIEQGQKFKRLTNCVVNNRVI